MTNEPLLKLKNPNGSTQEITIEQLCVSNHITYQALVAVLVRKGIISEDELLEEVKRVQNLRFDENG
ncbi:hypothetical protein KAH81_06070 [bacterium]|nr:hypothetical protein [bacterium]